MHKTGATLFFTLFIVFVNAQTEFITTWKTDNAGTSENNEITIPTFPGETYNYTVDWGDGKTDSNILGSITHSYDTPGTYQVSIYGTFPRIYFNESGDRDKILNIKQWGDNQWTSMESAFAGCSNLSVAANDTPNLSNVTSLRKMFFYCNYAFDSSVNREYTNFNGVENFNNWNVGTITDLSNMFNKSAFNQDISSWVVSKVTDMSYLFYSSPFNGDVGNWDVSNVQNMEGIFGSGTFRGDVTQWDVSNVTNMAFMFNSTYFDQDISSWDVGNVTNMRHMLSQCSFNQDIGNWNVSNVIDMSNMFNDNDLSRENYDKILIGWSQLPSLQTGLPLGAKDVQYCLGKDAREILINIYNWSIVDQGENCAEEMPFITTWKTDNPGPSGDNQITIPTNPTEVYNYNIDWGDGSSDAGVTADITHTYAIQGTYQVSITGRFPHIYFNNSGADYPYQHPKNTSDTDKIISIDQWGTIRWNSMSFAFAGCSNLDVLATDIPDFSKGINLSYMFYGCSSLVGNETMAQWDLSHITMSAPGMFSGATQFNQPIGDWDVSNIRYLDGMFQNATSFNQNLENWDIGKVENMDAMFNGSGISILNYDRLLNAWSSLPSLVNNVKLGAIDTNYCNSEGARQELINTYGWEFIDAGKDCSSTYFITTWKTDNPGVSEDNQITMPTFPGELYDYTVDWGDGSSDTNVTGDITHTYATAGTYQVSISGTFPRIYFNNLTIPKEILDDEEKILSIQQWGTNEWSSMDSAFAGCKNLEIKAKDTPDLSNLTSLRSAFYANEKLTTEGNFENWDVSTVTNMSLMFYYTNFNQDIGNWEVSNVTALNGTFALNTSFNQDISKWDVSNVIDLSVIFSGASSFNQPLNEWDVSNVRNFNGTFADTSLNQPLDNWDTKNAINMSSMFAGATFFNQNINSWNVSSVKNMGGMFIDARSFNQSLDNWDTSNVDTMTNMFASASAFNQDISSWDVSNVTEMNAMFSRATSFNQDISSWDVSNVTEMRNMFLEASSFNQPLQKWDVSKVYNMNTMFSQATSFNQDLGGWDVSKVSDMENMLVGVNLSIENYNSLLVGWSELPNLNEGVILDAGNNLYCGTSAERQRIKDAYDWIINDGGEVPFCNEDNDADGVLDHLDNCLNTPGGAVVDANGCGIIPADVISIYGEAPTCINESNGSIEISSILVDHSFNIAIASETLNTTYSDVLLNQALKIENLPAGLYMITIEIPDALYEKTFGVTINEVGSVTGKRLSIDTKNKTATYLVSGSYIYMAEVNGKAEIFAFDSTAPHEIQLVDLGDYNSISISGKNDCQGKVEDTFAVGGDVFVYPNMTKDVVFIHGLLSNAHVKVYDMAGRIIIEKDILRDANEALSLEGFGPGMYPIKIITKGKTNSFKIIKQ